MANENKITPINVLPSIHAEIKSLADNYEQITDNREKNKLIDSKISLCFKMMEREILSLSFELTAISKVAKNLVTSHAKMMSLFQEMTNDLNDVESEDSNLPKHGDLYQENGEVVGWVKRASSTWVEIEFMDDDRKNENMTLSEFVQSQE